MRSRLAIVLVLVLAPAALAATKNGITPKTPQQGAAVNAGSRPVFRGRASSGRDVWIVVADSKDKNADGVIGLNGKGKPTKHLEVLQRAKLSGHRFSAKALLYDYKGWWLNRPGTYYWQAHQIECPLDSKDCYQEGPVRKLRVK